MKSAVTAGGAGRPPRPADARRTATTIGAVEGSIIAAIIVTQTPTNQPRPPRSVPGPASMPRMRSRVTIQVTSATPSSAATVRAGLSGNRRRAAAATATPHASADEYRKVAS